MTIFAQAFKIPSSPVETKFHGNIGEVISGIFEYAIPIAGIFMLGMIIVGGYHLMISAGNPDKVKEGQNKISLGILGFIVVFISWFVFRIVETIFGINILG